MRAPDVIAIDGPSGAGKGTVARAVAQALDCRHIDTGAMYRAVAWRTLQQGRALDDEPAVAAVASGADFALDGTRVSIDGHDVSRAIRTPEMDVAAAAVARLPRVRAALVARQRSLAGAGSLVMEGRDIGNDRLSGGAGEDLPRRRSGGEGVPPRAGSGAPVVAGNGRGGRGPRPRRA